MQTKIVLTGSFSVGKTTLLELFHNQAYCIPEVARTTLGSNPSVQSNPEFQNFVLGKQIDSERLAEAGGFPLVICDRGTIDVVAFSRYYGHQEPKIVHHYDQVFLCSPDGVPCAYGEQAQQMRMSLHQIFLELLTEKRLPFLLLEGDSQTRYMQIKSELAGRGIEGNFRSPQEKK